jgi:hypothetical protein
VHARGLEVGWSEPRTGRFDLAEPAMAALFWAEVEAECQRLTQVGKLESPAPVGPLPVRRVWVPALSPRPPGRRESSRPVGRARSAATARSVAASAMAGSRAPAEASQADPADPALAEPAVSPVALVPAPRLATPAETGQHWVVRDPDGDDLAANRPGDSARARARQLRREHPVRSAAADLLGNGSVARRFAAGAKGERAVGRALDRWAARRGWRVLHAVPVGRNGADIDHVIIGPFGVVTVNTKTSGTSVWVGEYGMTIGGKAVDYLRKSRAEARRARQLLSKAAGTGVPVASVIVFVGVRRFSMTRGGPADVAVLRSPRALRRWLRKQPQVLEEQSVSLLYEVARKPATWQPAPPPRCR